MRGIGFLWTLLIAGCGGASSAPDATPELPIDGELALQLGARSPLEEPPITVFASGTGGELGEPITATQGDVVLVGVQRGGAVTAVYQGETETATVTFLGIEPDDVLSAGDRMASGGGLRPAITVTWPAAAGATRYDALTACGAAAAPGDALTLQASFDAACEPDAETDLLVVARAGDEVLGWSRLDDVGFGTVGAVTAWSPAESFTITIENTVGITGPYTIGAFPVVEDLEVGLLAVSGANPSGPITGSGDWVRGTETRVVANLSRDGFDGTIVRSDVLPAEAAAWTLDATTLTPAVSQPVRTDDYIQWAQEHSDYDGAVVTMRWMRGSRSYRWTAIAPPDFGMRMPPLPEGLAGVVPLAGDNNVVMTVRLHDFDDDADHAAMRRRPEFQLVDPRGPGGVGSWAERYASSVVTGAGF